MTYLVDWRAISCDAVDPRLRLNGNLSAHRCIALLGDGWQHALGKSAGMEFVEQQLVGHLHMTDDRVSHDLLTLLSTSSMSLHIDIDEVLGGKICICLGTNPSIVSYSEGTAACSKEGRKMFRPVEAKQSSMGPPFLPAACRPCSCRSESHWLPWSLPNTGLLAKLLSLYLVTAIPGCGVSSGLMYSRSGLIRRFWSSCERCYVSRSSQCFYILQVCTSSRDPGDNDAADATLSPQL